ncbi:hypothetical protein PTSG_07268 [Salpingoeca rosetta]|uniref:Uncharacterized protein n=1 Tax=Salpingoeca rosetta (strain ATCC 50818 / BSB-021) TaxID=946362 RepID=F2UIX9_SALR5|nr:uncharacterized protein PTSG_07268 [Salpingoeca rosetta]EGD76927.1 hypothetical protein PTSG_07268 [Salpingoeca rosetta]|eukprot:XP_004990767.1 hypothetical protein PTSG_07268 [Salpingoeca rosetta]
MPTAAAATSPIRLPLLCSCSVPTCVSKDGWRCTHMMGWKEQLWTHTSMVMLGTSNHSEQFMAGVSAVTIITIIAIDCTAAITRRPTPAPIWREADIAHVSRSDEEEAHEAVEPTTMTMTSDGATTADVWLHLDERALCILSISSSSSPSLVPNSSGSGHGRGAFPMRCAPAEACSRQPPTQAGRQASSLLLLVTAVMMAVRACALCAVFGAAPMKTRKDTTRAHHFSPVISSFCSISDDDGGRGM